ncbi:MAG: hypothetical protein GX639_00525 [Fibrobacter sp.]|nr:hypothetical protein [Fibrobacter sp.]
MVNSIQVVAATIGVKCRAKYDIGFATIENYQQEQYDEPLSVFNLEERYMVVLRSKGINVYGQFWKFC